MIPPLSDFAPAIIAAIMAAVGLLMVWLSVREAHSGERKAAKAAREAERRAREA
jgi:hypothetical protein